MTSVPRQVPDLADPLGECLHLLKLTGTLYCRSELTAPWGIELPPFEGCMMFHIVTAGHCWLEVAGEEPQLLAQGSLTLIPHGEGHNIRSSLDDELVPLFDIPVERVSDRYEILRHGGGGEPTQVTCGVVRFDNLTGRRLISQLPVVLKADGWSEEEDSWLHHSLRFIAREAKAQKPGGETVITHLADILVIQAIRSWLENAVSPENGWLMALRDSHIGRSLTLIHSKPEASWSVAALAKEVGMSRSGFSARFSHLVGETVMHYLTQWRMQLAYEELRDTTDTLSVLAEKLGYLSEVSFSRAFKRVYGVSPGQVRRLGSRDNHMQAIVPVQN